jgi:hypothetical protein
MAGLFVTIKAGVRPINSKSFDAARFRGIQEEATALEQPVLYGSDRP